jgi:hypothetical protein
MNPARRIDFSLPLSPKTKPAGARRRALSLLACIAALWAAPVNATVLIYNGTIKDYDVTFSAAKTTQHCFLVTDQLAQQVVFIYYYRMPGGKKKLVPGDITSVNAVVFPRPDGKAVWTFSISEYHDLGGGAFIDTALFLSGVETFLNTNSSNGTLIKSAGARSLAGISRIAAAALVGRYDEQSITASFDQKRTVEANAGQKTLSQTKDDLVGYLKSIGYGI